MSVLESSVLEVGTVNFSIEPEWLTDFIRDLWAEGSYHVAFETLDCLIGLERKHKVGVINGTHKLITDTDGEGSCVEDDWKPDLVRCAFGQYPDPDNLYALAEKGAKLERDVERLQDMAISVIYRAMSEIHDGKVLYDFKFLLRRFPDEALERNDVEYRWPLGPSGPKKLVFGNWEEGYATLPGPRHLSDLVPTAVELPDVEEYIERQLELDVAELPGPDRDLLSENGYVLPNGTYLPCEWMEHQWLASKIEEDLHIPEDKLVKIARSQVNTDLIGVYLPSDDYEPTIEQMGTVVIWCARHDVERPAWTRVV